MVRDQQNIGVDVAKELTFKTFKLMPEIVAVLNSEDQGLNI